MKRLILLLVPAALFAGQSRFARLGEFDGKVEVQLHAANPNVKVSISAEGMALHGDVIRVLDMVRRAKIEKVGYQIRAATGGAAGPAAPGAPPAAPPPPPH